ncbi:hypothetical protein GGI12_002812 [Dipsacomyces acuminosporus]|nr:hypothetical protein GGI12_002812 [Dipsacomyces acuminosporus]
MAADATLASVVLEPAEEEVLGTIPWRQSRQQPERDNSTRLYDSEWWQRRICRQLLRKTIELDDAVDIIVGSRSVCFVVRALLIAGDAKAGSVSAAVSGGTVERSTAFDIVKRQHKGPAGAPGYEAEVAGLAREIQGYFDSKDRFRHLGITPLQAVFVNGVSGVGKTTAIKGALKGLRYPCVHGDLGDVAVNAAGTESADEYVAMALSDLADRAQAAAPCVVVLDRVHVLGDKELTQELDKLCSHFVRFVQELHHDVFLVAESGLELGRMPASIQRSEVLQHGLLIPVPTRPRREQMIKSVLAEFHAATSAGAQIDRGDVSLTALARQVANATAGFVARDIVGLCRQSFLRMLRESASSSLSAGDLADMRFIESFSRLSLSDINSNAAAASAELPKWHNFADSLQSVRPSQQLEFESVLPSRLWSDIGGYSETKKMLQRFMRLATADTSCQLGIRPPAGVLLYGPTGCGKTAMALAMIAETACNVICIRASELFSKYLGETEARLRRLFHAARAAAPCIVFMDEVDSIAARREWSSVESGGPSLRVLSTLLNEMDGVHEAKGVIAIGCTNQLDKIDDAILRPGRFDQLVEIGCPTLEDRIGILQTMARRSPLEADVDAVAIAQATPGFSGADLEQLFREAGLSAMRASSDVVALSMDDFAFALDKVRTQTVELGE